MSTWILIVGMAAHFSSSGVTMTSIGFNTEAACTVAAEKLKVEADKAGWRSVLVVCVKT